MYILQEEESFYDLASCDTRVTNGTDEFTLRFSGVKRGRLLLWQRRECIIRKWSWSQCCWWERPWTETAVFLSPNRQPFLCILIWLHFCLVALSFFFLSLLLEQVPCSCLITVLYIGQISTVTPASTHTRCPKQTTFSLIIFADESHWSVCKKSQIFRLSLGVFIF